MSTFDSREQAFESKYAHDEQLQFKVTARRNKLLGQWAASRLERTDVDAYAKEVVLSDFEAPGDDDVLQKLLADFKTAGIAITADELRNKMDSLLVDAKAQVMTE